MTKKLLLMALALLVSVPMALADTGCTTATPVLKVVMVGSSAQFNATAFAAQAIINAESGATFNLFSVKGKDTAGTGTANIVDSRPTSKPTDSATMWVAWDALATCNVWVYFSTDSAVGVKDFMAYGKVGTKSYAFAYGELSTLMDGNSGAWCGSSCSQNKVFGLTDTNLYNSGDNLPTSIITLLNKVPSTDTTAPAYCASGVFCYFNVAATDIRPEDALYGTTRALSTYDSKALNGLGYNSTGCGGDGLNPGKVGCAIYSALGTGSKFNVLTFKLSGTDPIASGVIPPTTTLNIGAAPLVVIVNNGDSAGFGSLSGSNYVYTNINRYTLSQVFQGNISHTGALLTTGASVPDSTPTLQVVQREPLSGTYNAFEFTGVRTLGGSGNPFEGKVANTSVLSNANSGQEVGVNPATGNFLTNSTDCPTTGFPTGAVACNDPLLLTTAGGSKRIRSIGTGEEVPGIVNAQSGQSTSASAAPDGIGYSFWSYGNLKPASGKGHYLTVDNVDPLFNVPSDDPQGAYNIPTCTAPPCSLIPFTHVVDGTYPLWSILRVVTFKTVPAAVTQLINQEISSSNTDSLDDYYPLLNASGNLQLFVFRSHFKQSGGPASPLNGHKTCTSFSPPTPAATCLVDAGSDEGGSIVTVQQDVDSFHDFGTEIYDVRQ